MDERAGAFVLRRNLRGREPSIGLARILANNCLVGVSITYSTGDNRDSTALRASLVHLLKSARGHI
jgi:hypothetical protein